MALVSCREKSLAAMGALANFAAQILRLALRRYSRTAGDTPATAGVQLMRSDVLAGDGVQFLDCLMRQSKASASNILSQVFHR